MSLFISNYIPSDCVNLDKRFSQAGSNFIGKLMKCLPYMKFYHSMYPGLDLHTYRRIVSSTYEGTFINAKYAFKGNKFSRLINLLYGTIAIIRICYSSHEKNIWYYNMLTPEFIVSAMVNKYLFRKNIFVILADYDARDLVLAKSQNAVLKIVDGIISLRTLSSKISCGKNKVIHGIVSEQSKRIKIQPPEKGLEHNNKVLLSGLLSEKLGLSLALDAFTKLPQYELIITGKGELEKKARFYAANYPNIKYYKFLPFEDYLNILREADICLSLRNPDYLNNNFEFPSKIIEYLEFGKKVITNIDYEKLPKELYYKTDYSVKDLIRSIKSCPAYSNKDSISKKLRQKFGCKVWRDAIEKMEK